jgi:hypothetical protein
MLPEVSCCNIQITENRAETQWQVSLSQDPTPCSYIKYVMSQQWAMPNSLFPRTHADTHDTHDTHVGTSTIHLHLQGLLETLWSYPAVREGILGPKGGGVSSRRLQKTVQWEASWFIPLAKYYQRNQITKDKMGLACSTDKSYEN